VGWICGYSNPLPRTCVELLAAATSGDPSDLAQALPVYRDLHSLLRWDARTEFVQAIKLSMDVAGRKGGVCRPPRGPLPEQVYRQVTAATEAAIGRGYK
jgi:4-hydroxy-tetrahydrodipicolinate synthase